MYNSLNSSTGGAKNADLNPVECMGPASNSLGVVGLVGDRIHNFDTLLCVEEWSHKRSRER